MPRKSGRIWSADSWNIRRTHYVRIDRQVDWRSGLSNLRTRSIELHGELAPQVLGYCEQVASLLAEMPMRQTGCSWLDTQTSISTRLEWGSLMQHCLAERGAAVSQSADWSPNIEVSVQIDDRRPELGVAIAEKMAVSRFVPTSQDDWYRSGLQYVANDRAKHSLRLFQRLCRRQIPQIHRR